MKREEKNSAALRVLVRRPQLVMHDIKTLCSWINGCIASYTRSHVQQLKGERSRYLYTATYSETRITAVYISKCRTDQH